MFLHEDDYSIWQAMADTDQGGRDQAADALPRLGKRDSVKPTKRALILGAWIGRSRSGDHGVIPYRIRRTGYLLGVAAERWEYGESLSSRFQCHC